MSKYSPKFKYSAKLASGQVVGRRSDRTYSHYWHCSFTQGEKGPITQGGFAGSLILAQKAARAMEANFPGWACVVQIVPVQIEGKQ